MHSFSKTIPESLARPALKYYLSVQIAAKQEELKRLDNELKKQASQKDYQEGKGVMASMAWYLPKSVSGISETAKKTIDEKSQQLRKEREQTELELKALESDDINSLNSNFRRKFLAESVIAFLKQPPDRDGQLEIHRAIRSGVSREHIEFILSVSPEQLKAWGGANPDKRKQPLHHAAIAGRDDLIDLFRTQGVDLRDPCKRGRTLTHYAAQFGHAHLLQKYKTELTYGGDLKGRNPLHLAAKFSRENAVSTLFALNPQLAWIPDKEGAWPVTLAFSRSRANAKDRRGQLRSVAQLCELMNASLSDTSDRETKLESTLEDPCQQIASVYSALASYGKNLISGLKIHIKNKKGISTYTIEVLYDSLNPDGVKCVALIPDNINENPKVLFLGKEMTAESQKLIESLQAYKKNTFNWGSREEVMTKELLPMLLDLPGTATRPNTIELFGHGVGGIDAQLALYTLLKNAESPLPSLKLMVRNSFRSISEKANQQAMAIAKKLMSDGKMKIECIFIETQGCPTFLLGLKPQYLLQGTPSCQVLQVKDTHLVEQLKALIIDYAIIFDDCKKVSDELKEQTLKVRNRRELEQKTDMYSQIQKKLWVSSLETEEQKMKNLEIHQNTLLSELAHSTSKIAHSEMQAFSDLEHAEPAGTEFTITDLSGHLVFPDEWTEMHLQQGLRSSELEFKREIKTPESFRPRVWGEDSISQFIDRRPARPPELNLYACGEYLYHHMINDIVRFEQNDKVAVPNSTGKPQEYLVATKPITFEGITNAVLVPENGQGAVKIMFRGTGDAASTHRDLDQKGAGARTHFLSSPHFIENVRASIRKLLEHRRKNKISESDPIEIEIGGHSLGGADAQLLMINLMQEINRSHLSAEASELKKITALRMMAYNAPGISHENNRRGIEAAKALRKRGITIDAYYQRVQNDRVQEAGETHLFIENSKVVSPDIAKVEVLKIEHTSSFIGWLRSPPHQDLHFQGKDSMFEKRVFRNTEPDTVKNMEAEFAKRIEGTGTSWLKWFTEIATESSMKLHIKPRGFIQTATFKPTIVEQKSAVERKRPTT